MDLGEEYHRGKCSNHILEIGISYVLYIGLSGTFLFQEESPTDA